jgi:ribosome-associated translation inhibitor RaiA
MMRISVASPGNHLDPADVDRIERDLEKIDRRLHEYEQVAATVRVAETQGVPGFHVTLELDYGRNHLIAKADNADLGQAVREAREEVLRQINDRSRRGHSWFAKRR